MRIDDFQISFDFDSISNVSEPIVITVEIAGVNKENIQNVSKTEKEDKSSLSKYVEDDFDFDCPSTDLRDLYNNDIGNVPTRLLTYEEEQEYFKKILSGDKKAKSEFIDLNLRLVIAQAKLYTENANVFSNMDIIQEGNIGLINAVEKYDPSKGTKFSTFAVWWINQSIKRALEDKTRTIRIPNHRVQQINRINKFVQKFKSENSVEPSIAEIAIELQCSQKSIIKALNYNAGVTSINRNCTEDKETELGDILSDGFNLEDHIVNKENLHLLKESIKLLDEQEKELIVLRFYKNYKISQIEVMLDIPRNKINKILQSAFDKMKKFLLNAK